MKTTVTTRGQTVIPAKIRRAHRITPRTRLEWVDTSAVLAFMGGEQGAGKVERLLRGARAGRVQVLACSITRMEVFYTALRAKGEDEEAIGRETPSEAAA